VDESMYQPRPLPEKDLFTPQPELPKAPEVKQPEPPPGPVIRQRHIIVKGETLWHLAVVYYNDGHKWPEIQKVNGGIDPKKLSIGQEILIPDLGGTSSYRFTTY